MNLNLFSYIICVLAIGWSGASPPTTINVAPPLPTMIPNISEQNTGLKLVPTKRKHLVSSETLQKQAKAAKSQ